jgi:hypothetical protein
MLGTQIDHIFIIDACGTDHCLVLQVIGRDSQWYNENHTEYCYAGNTD